jgi:hypothetical protein
MAAEAPCIDVPPVMLTFVFAGAGEVVRDVALEAGVLFDLKVEIREPAADGGGRGLGALVASNSGVGTEALLVSDDLGEDGRLDM